MYLAYNATTNSHILIACWKYLKKPTLFNLYKPHLMLFERGWKPDPNGVYMISRMTCGNDERCSKSKVQSKYTKQEQSKHRPLKKLKVGSGAIE